MTALIQVNGNAHNNSPIRILCGAPSYIGAIFSDCRPCEALDQVKSAEDPDYSTNDPDPTRGDTPGSAAHCTVAQSSPHGLCKFEFPESEIVFTDLIGSGEHAVIYRITAGGSNFAFKVVRLSLVLFYCKHILISTYRIGTMPMMYPIQPIPNRMCTAIGNHQRTRGFHIFRPRQTLR